MKSRFRFFPKQGLIDHSIEDMIGLHDVIDAFEATGTIEQLIDDWKKAATKSIDSIYEQMMSLDVSDFVYLDHFRLHEEGTSINSYLGWFLTASLSAEVGGKLNKKLWKDTDAIKRFRMLDNDQLNPESLLKTYDGPSKAIGGVYGNIHFDSTRASQLPLSDLVEGGPFC